MELGRLRELTRALYYNRECKCTSPNFDIICFGLSFVYQKVVSTKVPQGFGIPEIGANPNT